MNLSALNHKRYDNLYQVTQSHLKATLLDKCIFFWQISTYTLNDNKKWFTRSIATLASDAKISQRSVSRYLKEFSEQGLIEKKSILKMKKHLYIRITSKLLLLLGMRKEDQQKSNLIKNTNNFDLCQPGVIKNDSAALSIYKDNIVNTVNSNVTEKPTVNSSLQEDSNQSLFSKKKKFDCNTAKEVSNDQKYTSYVKGVVKNLTKQHNIKLSDPNKIIAEILFSLTNTAHQLVGIHNPYHRINIIAKLLREKKWVTPKGFYNHSEVGKKYKNDINKLYNINQQQTKSNHAPNQTNKDTIAKSKKVAINNYLHDREKNELVNKIKELDSEIISQKHYLSQLKSWRKAPNPSPNSDILIRSVLMKINNLCCEKDLLREKYNTLLKKAS